MIKTFALYFIILLAVAFYASAFYLGYLILLLIFGKVLGAIIFGSLILFVALREWQKKRTSK